MSWWDTQIDLTNGEFIMAIFAGIGVATCVWHLAQAVASIIESEQQRRRAKQRQQQVGAGDFPGAPW